MGVPRDLFGALSKMCWLPLGDIFNVIPQKLKLPMNFFDTFPECSLPSTSTVSKNTIKMIDHHVRLRDVTGQSYPIYACTRPSHLRY